jgi:hypothetical protein
VVACEGETPKKWMLLTAEVVADTQMAATILRWYSYRWRVKSDHKILKSGCQVERYRLAGDGMKTTVIRSFGVCDRLCNIFVILNLYTTFCNYG